MRLFDSNKGDFDCPGCQDIRDDWVYSYFDLPENSSVQFAVKTGAAYAGKFYMPFVKFKAMYNNDISTLQEGKMD